MKTALIIGADEFLGLSLCERLMDEGVHVDVILAEPEDKTRQLYLEERLMWLARNGLFQIIDEIGEKEYDRICVQYGSGCLPEERAEPLYWIVYSEDHGDWEKNGQRGTAKAIILPPLYGPWTEAKEDGESRIFLEDAVCGLMNQLEAYGTEDENQIITLEIKEKTQKTEAEEKIKEWKRQFSSIFDIF
ncbi:MULTISPECIES: hypothetical protein [Bacillus amyloliquefaciens group]|uniref:hypothetical protein n=1 Tax=Bacillus amyloliquefaciens group TaxID=1938374 RepID=UPI00083DEC16|nr:hypothetical protein [Bacillus velezensis]MEB3694783.1 hypothetical protein [Bacillus amyloliquefaciens]MCP1564791.1 hypothetical protein [Bacillus velezensis]MEC1134987.1 hypothetical protein [Bacillus velezensis]ODB67140.1 hypothetical protein A7313_09805 [Bacillus velezensis]QKF32976.1 hypothetical protein HPQ66_05570 [Bacillus velezensis]